MTINANVVGVLAMLAGYCAVYLVLVWGVFKVFTVKRYFISYVTQKAHQTALFQNCVSKIHPVDWQHTTNLNSSGVRYRVVSWQRVSKKEADNFEKGKYLKCDTPRK
jgi:hypothetical protein